MFIRLFSSLIIACCHVPFLHSPSLVPHLSAPHSLTNTHTHPYTVIAVVALINYDLLQSRNKSNEWWQWKQHCRRMQTANCKKKSERKAIANTRQRENIIACNNGTSKLNAKKEMLAKEKKALMVEIAEKINCRLICSITFLRWSF